MVKGIAPLYLDTIWGIWGSNYDIGQVHILSTWGYKNMLLLSHSHRVFLQTSAFKAGAGA